MSHFQKTDRSSVYIPSITVDSYRRKPNTTNNF